MHDFALHSFKSLCPSRSSSLVQPSPMMASELGSRLGTTRLHNAVCVPTALRREILGNTTASLRPEVVSSGSCKSRGLDSIDNAAACRAAQPFSERELAWGGSGNWEWMAFGCVVAMGQGRSYFNRNSKRPGESCGTAGRSCICA